MYAHRMSIKMKRYVNMDVFISGWAMQIAGYLFLNRRWEEDQQIITKCLNVFKDVNTRAQVE